jgi:lipoate-protein ligase A
LDANQVFLQWIFSPNSLPISIEARYRLFIEPIVSTYQNLGIPAEMRPVNDIQVNGRKIGGCGAARIGEAELLVSSFIFDIDLATMASVLKVETVKMRDKLYQNLTEYVTSITRELGSPSPQAPIVDTYLEQVSTLLKRDVYIDDLSVLEKEQLERTEGLLASNQWTFDGGGRRVAGVKIQEGVVMHHAAFKSRGGLIRWVVFLADENIVDATLEGDFTIYPLDAPVLLANALLGRRLGIQLRSEWETLFPSVVQQSPGVSASDMFAPLEMIAAELVRSQ